MTIQHIVNFNHASTYLDQEDKQALQDMNGLQGRIAASLVWYNQLALYDFSHRSDIVFKMSAF
jgi:hypothetical protein